MRKKRILAGLLALVMAFVTIFAQGGIAVFASETQMQEFVVENVHDAIPLLDIEGLWEWFLENDVHAVMNEMAYRNARIETEGRIFIVPLPAEVRHNAYVMRDVLDSYHAAIAMQDEQLEPITFLIVPLNAEESFETLFWINPTVFAASNNRNLSSIVLENTAIHDSTIRGACGGVPTVDQLISFYSYTLAMINNILTRYHQSDNTLWNATTPVTVQDFVVRPNAPHGNHNLHICMGDIKIAIQPN